MARDVTAGVPLLDQGTHKNQIPGQRVGNGPYKVVLWPSCNEATIQLRIARPERLKPSDKSLVQENENLDRSVRRSGAVVRRYSVHNGLGYMFTQTFKNDPGTASGLDAAVKGFVRRLVRAGVDEPYLWVAEKGSKRGRLHVHFLCEWWDRLQAVEVCDVCAVPNLRKVRADIPPAGSFCVGCLWGHGYVGRPSEAVGDPRKAAGYVSKYVGKDLAGLVEAYKNRYHCARGHQPEPMRAGFFSYLDALLALSDHAGEALQGFALHDEVEDWKAPPTWAIRW